MNREMMNGEKETEIDLILPCYNPAPGWEQYLIEKKRALNRKFETVHFRIIVVSDGSVCGYEPETVSRLKNAIPDICIVDYQPNRGKGYALREAARHGRSSYTLYTDYDFPYTDDSMERVIRALFAGADVVVAVRDKNYRKRLPVFRKILSFASHFCNGCLLNLKIRDTQGGLKGFNRTGKSLFLSTTINGFLFDTEFVRKAQRKKLNIVAIPAQIREGILVSDMNARTVKCEIKNLFSILFGR